MKLHTLLLSSSVLLGAAAVVNAGDRNPFGNGELPEILKPFDTDGNGRFSEEERQAYLLAVREGQVPRPDRPERPDRPDHPRANPFDTDGDGVLSDEEKAAAQEAIRARILEQRSKRFDDLDKNDDGFLILDEINGIPGIREGHAARILAHLDKDLDKQVSKEEFLHALRSPLPPGPRPGDGGGTPPVGGR